MNRQVFGSKFQHATKDSCVLGVSEELSIHLRFQKSLELFDFLEKGCENIINTKKASKQIHLIVDKRKSFINRFLLSSFHSSF